MTSIAQIRTKDQPFSVVVVSNGPGELATWVRPIAEKLHQQLLMKPRSQTSRISMKLVLVPCPNSTGKEKEAAKKWNQFDQIINAKYFWKLLVNPKKYSNWTNKGLVIFLGGDQFWSVLLSARLGYLHITYAEWVARWPQWNNQICAMSSKVIKQVPAKYRNRCKVVGDLMADLEIPLASSKRLRNGKWIALLPGSKKAKLSVGVPFMLELADKLKKEIPESNFLIPIAPTTNIKEIKKLSTIENPISKKYNSEIKEIVNQNSDYLKKFLITGQGTKIYLEEESPAHLSLSQCDLAITTIGANTSELGALCVPMIVIVPTQHLDVMKAWDGAFGLLARLPILNNLFSFILGKWRLRNKGLLAWPNIAAGRIIVPEKVGKIIPSEIAKEATEWLNSPKRLEGQREDLRLLRGKPGAVNSMTNEILKIIKNNL